MFRVDLSTPQIAIMAASFVYAVLFISILVVGGLDQATAFLRGTHETLAMVLQGSSDAIAMLLLGSRDAIA